MMKDNALEGIEQQLGKRRDFDAPPLHLVATGFIRRYCNPYYGGGDWYHEGGKIERDALVRLFASILRREDDGDYYLVTPVEKWRIEVELHPLMVTDIAVLEESGKLVATLNTGKLLRWMKRTVCFLIQRQMTSPCCNWTTGSLPCSTGLPGTAWLL